MADTGKPGSWVRRFLLEHLIGERNLSVNTQRSYRDTLALLIPFAAREAHKKVGELAVADVSGKCVGGFLADLEGTRGCAISSRNQRLAAIHAFSHFVAAHSPEHIEWCGQIRAIPFKNCTTKPITYLEKPAMDALLAAPDLKTAQGQRDRLLLLFLYNTGARAGEAAQLLIGNLDLGAVPGRDLSPVKIHGKGRKERRCPLWPQTVKELRPAISARQSDQHVFLNR